MDDAADAGGLASVARLIDPHAVLRSTWPLRGGVSSRMTALELVRADGTPQRVIVRRPPEYEFQRNSRFAADEFALLKHLQSAAVRAPVPRLLDESGAVFALPYSVVDYIDGEPDCAPRDLSDYLAQFARGLAEIHRIDGADPALTFVAPYTPAYQRDTEGAPGEARIRAVLATADLSTPRNPPVLLHGDYWAGNVLWSSGRLVGVVDWEEARRGDPVVDLAISRLDVLWAFGVDAMHEFTRRYRELTDVDLTDLPLWDLDAALRPGAYLELWASAWPALGRPEITEAAMRRDLALFVELAVAALGD